MLLITGFTRLIEKRQKGNTIFQGSYQHSEKTSPGRIRVIGSAGGEKLYK
jgi:hypothetical protein